MSRQPFPQFELASNSTIVGLERLVKTCPICSKKYIFINNHLRDTKDDEDHAVLRVLES